jgi:hypothetical protein
MSLLALLLLTQLQTLDLDLDLNWEGVENEQVTPTVRTSSRPAPQPFVVVGEPKSGPVAWDAGEPATRASKKLLELVDSIDATRTDTAYSHGTRVRRKAGVYHFDCSGMINWMLERVALTALETLKRERPVAASYVRVIQKAPTSRSRGGWQQIANIVDVEPGDVFAWRRPKDWPKGGNSGHVGLVMARPAPVLHLKNAYVVRVVDSTRWQHQDDTRSDDQTGFGMGTILFMTDDAGQPIGYAWFGSESGGYYETDVVFGRVH